MQSVVRQISMLFIDNKESHGSHGNFYEGEQEQCCSVPVGALYGGRRVSQWHKLCWSRAGITLAGTTGQPRGFPGYCTSRFDFMILWSVSPKVSCFVFLSNFVVQYGSTVGMVFSAIICGHLCCKHWQVDRQAGTDARMRPSFKLEGTARVRMLGKGGRTIGDFVRRNIPVIQRYRPDILILLLGDNDTGCDTSAEEIANHLIALASSSAG